MKNRDRLLRKMAALPTQVRSAMKQALAQGADELTAMQKRLAPVGPPSGAQAKKGARPGALRDSIKQTWGDSKVSYASLRGRGGIKGDPDLTVTITAGNSAVRYAHLVEFPTAPHIVGGKFKGAQHPGTQAQPFFYPPYRALRRRIKSRVTRATKKAIQRVASGQ